MFDGVHKQCHGVTLAIVCTNTNLLDNKLTMQPEQLETTLHQLNMHTHTHTHMHATRRTWSQKKLLVS